VCHLHRKVEGNFGQSELLIGDRACIERVLGRPQFHSLQHKMFRSMDVL